jgi:hypothetical protein
MSARKTVGPARFEPPTDAVVVPPRTYDCERYEECLLTAARKLWRSWSCRGCARCPEDARLEVWKSSQPPSRAVLRRR